jgi:hypothetical protein
VSPTATACLQDRFRLEANAGRCEDAVGDARRFIALDPASWRPYQYLANALAGSEAARESTLLASEQWWTRRDGAFREVTELRARAQLDVLWGNFDHARTTLEAWEEALRLNNDEYDHLPLFHLRTELALESGHLEEAARLADELLARRSAWTPSASIYGDGRIAAWSVRVSAAS